MIANYEPSVTMKRYCHIGYFSAVESLLTGKNRE